MRSACCAKAVRRRAFGEHGELVAADPRDQVARAHAAGKTAADLDQQLVADLVAVAVVDLLEAVEVEQHQRERAPLALGPRPRPLELAVVELAVRQVGERIVHRHVLEGLLEELALGDVAADQHGAALGRGAWSDLQPAAAGRRLTSLTRRALCGLRISAMRASACGGLHREDAAPRALADDVREARAGVSRSATGARYS